MTEITTDATGKFKIEGLDAGTYYLKETEAPAGYNKLDTVVKVVIDHNGKINATEDQPAGATQIEVENKSGSNCLKPAAWVPPSSTCWAPSWFWALLCCSSPRSA